MYNYILIYDDEFGIRNVEFCETEDEVRQILADEEITSYDDLEEAYHYCRIFELYKLPEPVKKIEGIDLEEFLEQDEKNEEDEEE